MPRHLLLLLVLATSCLPALSRPAEDTDSERAQLRRQQHELEALHAQRLADCAKRFEVNKCRDKAMAEHRSRLKPLLERERSLDDEERANRALAQSLRSSVRQMDGVASAPAVRPARTASQPAVPKRVARSQAELEARRAEKLAKDEEQAAERIYQAQRRQAALAAHAKSVQERNARRAGTPSASLPVPTAASIAALPAASATSRH
ncbi:hypothetical protein [Roseateles microcysteis]|uniref:hypothetical protein n=1 Tax=Roseateles microcysteis TaxID=3119057 RepID=UPI002FE621EC